MIPYRLKRHRKRQHPGDSHMALVPFIDMMTILVVFLLIHMSDVDPIPNTKNITIPQSISQTKPRSSLVVMVTKTDVLVDGKAVASVSAIQSSQDSVIAPLKAVLSSQANSVLSGGSEADREVTIMGDRDLPYTVLKKIMQTCTSAKYGKVSLAVLEREGRA
jgi:biopolymer transport protein TolR